MSRNDPCYCGSGRKYKKCHGAPAAAAVGDDALSMTRRSELARASAAKQLDQELMDDLRAYALKHYGRTWFQQAAANFTIRETPELDEYESMMFFVWLMYHAPVSETAPMPLAWHWRESRRAGREPAKERLLQAHLDAPIGVWEVQSVERGVGVHMKDLLSGDERFVYDTASSMSLTPWLGLLGYIVDIDGVSFWGGLFAHALPPAEAAVVVREIRQLARVRTRPVPLTFRTDPEMHLEVLDQWRMSIDLMSAARSVRTLHNHDGDEVSIQSDRFDLVGARSLVLQQLSTLPGALPAERDGARDIIAVQRAPRASNVGMESVIIGSIAVAATSLTVETNSVKRADELKRAIERACGDRVRHRLRSAESMDALRERAMAAPPSALPPSRLPPSASATMAGQGFRSESAMPPEVHEAMRAMMAKFTASWADEKIPALGGATPRSAAQNPKLRPRLIALLKDMESRGPMPGTSVGMDFAAIRRELGL